jgi:hypothetical protein
VVQREVHINDFRAACAFEWEDKSKGLVKARVSFKSDASVIREANCVSRTVLYDVKRAPKEKKEKDSEFVKKLVHSSLRSRLDLFPTVFDVPEIKNIHFPPPDQVIDKHAPPLPELEYIGSNRNVILEGRNCPGNVTVMEINEEDDGEDGDEGKDQQSDKSIFLLLLLLS